MITFKKYCMSWLKKNGFFNVILEYTKRHELENNEVSSYFDNVRPENFIIQLIPIRQGTYEPDSNTYENILVNKVTEIYNLWLIELYKISPNYGIKFIKDSYNKNKHSMKQTLANKIIEFIAYNNRMPLEDEQQDLLPKL